MVWSQLPMAVNQIHLSSSKNRFGGQLINIDARSEKTRLKLLPELPLQQRGAERPVFLGVERHVLLVSSMDKIAQSRNITRRRRRRRAATTFTTLELAAWKALVDWNVHFGFFHRGASWFALAKGLLSSYSRGAGLLNALRNKACVAMQSERQGPN